MSTAKTIVKNAGFLVGSDIVSKVLSLFFLVYIARILGDTGFGKYSFAFSFVAMFTLFSDLGVMPLLIREISRDKKKIDYYLYNSLTLRVIASIAALILALISLPIYKTDFEIFLSVFLISFAMIFYNLAETLLALFQAEQKMEYPAYITISERIFTVILGIYAVTNGFGLLGITVVYFLSYFGMFIAAIILVRKKIHKIRFILDFKSMKAILKESAPFWFTVIFATIYFKINTIMLAFFKGYQPVGWYSAAYAVIETLVFIPLAFSRAIFPAMSEMYIKNKDMLRELLKKSVGYITIIAVPIAFGIAFFSDQIILLVYKEQFANSVLVLRILIWAVMLMFPSMILGNFLNAINKQKIFTYVTAISAVISIILNTILIPAYSYIGAAIATIITEGIVLITLVFFVMKENYEFTKLSMLVKISISAFVMIGILYALKNLSIFILIPIGAVSYFSALYITKGITNDDLRYFRSLFFR